MKAFLSFILIFGFGCAFAQSPITTAEYFIDSDPGVGNATPINVVSGNAVSLNFDVPLGALDPGIHYLHTRVKNDADKWSLYARRPFYVTSFDFGHTIVAAEYFIDSDPGVGNGTALSMTAGTEIAEEFAIPIDDLEPGIHHLHVRVQNSQDKWGHYGRKVFYILPEYPESNITAAEYFIDSDPGFGNGVSINIAPGQSISESFEIETSESLLLGDHVLHVRVWTDDDKWSLYAKSIFNISDQVGLEDLENALQIYPNPTANMLYLEAKQIELKTARIIDMTGRLVQETSLHNGSLDLSHLPAGDYLVQIESETGGGISKKITKQ